MGSAILRHVAVLGLLASLAQAGTIYVDDDAPPGGNGASWGTAFRYLQDALAVATSSDQVWVAQGVYKPDQDDAGIVNPGDRNATFTLNSGVGLYGGYRGCPGGDCTGGDPDARDTTRYETMLSGDLLGDDGPNYTHAGDNSRYVVFSSATGASARCDGFIITAGWTGVRCESRANASLAECTSTANFVGVEFSGGVEAKVSGCTITWNRCLGLAASDRLTIDGCTIARNSDTGVACNGDVTITGSVISGNGTAPCLGGPGSGVYCYESYPSSRVTITDCAITGNLAPEAGGGVYCGYGTELAITNSAIWWNQAGTGGGLECAGGNATLTASSVNANWAQVEGGGIRMDGSLGGSLSIINSTLAGNVATNGGGGVYSQLGSVTLTGSTISGNTSGIGAVYCDAATLTITGCVFTGNSGGAVDIFDGTSMMMSDTIFAGNATSNGAAAVRASRSSTSITDCLFAGNSATKPGAASGIQSVFGLPSTITNCTFSENAAGSSGSALWCENEPPTIANCILWGDTPQELAFTGDAPVVEFSDVAGGWAGSGNIDADPRFVGGPTGTWTARGAFDWRTYQVTFTDAGAAWAENALVGRLINPNTSQAGQFVIVANTAQTITVWADWPSVYLADSWIPAGRSYRIYDYHLAAGSPCINTASNYVPTLPATDLGGGPRLQQCRVDMGAYESPFPAATLLDCNHNGVADECDIYAGTSLDANQNGIPDECERCAGDLNCDGRIDFADINAFVSYLCGFGAWRSAHPGCDPRNGDINCDGRFGQGSFGDIDAFVSLLTTTQLPIACPGPGRCR